MSTNYRLMSIAAVILMIGPPSSFAWGQQPGGLANQAASAAASNVSNQIQGQLQQQAQQQAQQAQSQALAQAQAQQQAQVQAQAQQAQVQAQQVQAQQAQQVQAQIQQQSELQVQSIMNADVTRAAQLAQQAVAANQAQLSVQRLTDVHQRQFTGNQPPAQAGNRQGPFETLVDRFRFKQTHEAMDGPPLTLSETRLPTSGSVAPQTGDGSVTGTNTTRTPLIDRRETLADPRESLADPEAPSGDSPESVTDMKISLAGIRQNRATLNLPNGITETDVKLYDGIFGQHNPFRTDKLNSLPSVSALSEATQPNESNSPGAGGQEYSNLVAAAKARASGGGSQLSLGDRIAAAITQRRAEISLLRDQAIENADQQKLQTADKMEMILNTFVEAQVEARAASVKATSNSNSRLR